MGFLGAIGLKFLDMMEMGLGKVKPGACDQDMESVQQNDRDANTLAGSDEGCRRSQ